MVVHSQNGAAFVPVVGWENVGIELRCAGRHVEGLTKRALAPKAIVINGIAELDWICGSEM